MLVKLAIKSLWHRRLTVLLTALSIAVSTLVLLGTEHLRHEAKNGFSRTVSGTDLIVGARTGPINLLLYSVFDMGSPANNLSWDSFRRLASMDKVDWAVPLSMGDSHKGYAVVGTSDDFFTHFQYGNKQPLSFSQGQGFDGQQTLVMGSAVARALGYVLGDKLVLSHGMGKVSFSQHRGMPFTLSGVLKPTGTPVDRKLYIPIDAVAMLHGVSPSQEAGNHHHGDEHDHPRHGQTADSGPAVTAVLLGLNSRAAVLGVMRSINQAAYEPMTAIMPGLALTQLWSIMGNMETLLLVISVLVLIATLVGMSTMLLASIRERTRELAILRAIGAAPWVIGLLVQLEALLITLLGIGMALVLLASGLPWLSEFLTANYGLHLSDGLWRGALPALLGAILLGAWMVSLLPAISAWRSCLHRGLSVRF